jgi:hypothetical protein
MSKKKITLYTTRGLAKHLGKSYNYLRVVLGKMKIEPGVTEYEGFKFFGVSNNAWFAYPKDIDIEVIDAPELRPETKPK